MELGKLPVPGRPPNWDYSRARAYCAWSRCGWTFFCLVYHFSFLSPSLWNKVRYRLKGPLSPKTTHQPNPTPYTRVTNCPRQFPRKSLIVCSFILAHKDACSKTYFGNLCYNIKGFQINNTNNNSINLYLKSLLFITTNESTTKLL